MEKLNGEGIVKNLPVVTELTELRVTDEDTTLKGEHNNQVLSV